MRKASYSPISLKKRGPGNCIRSEGGQQMLCMGHSIPGVLCLLHKSPGCGSQAWVQLDTQLGKSYSKWWGADKHLPIDRQSSRSSLRSSCPLWGETTLIRKYTYQKREATCRYWPPAWCLSLLTSAVTGPLLACAVLSPMLCCPEKIGDPHQQWMLPHFSGRLLDHYSLSDVKCIYCSSRMTTEGLLMIILLLYNWERTFHLKNVAVPSCWSEETLGRKMNIEARLPRVPLAFSKTICSSSTHWGLQIHLSSPVLLVEEVQSHDMLCNLSSQ